MKRYFDSIKINRKAGLGTHLFLDVFPGMHRLKILKEIFGRSTEKTLKSLEISIKPYPGYAWIDVKKGRINLSWPYLKTGSDEYLCLDMVHELVHIKQLRKGMDLFDKRYSYVDRPTEIEAYKLVAEEAKKLGMDRKELEKYIIVPWISRTEFKRLMDRID